MPIRSRPELTLHDIPKKANTVLQLFLIICIGLGIRVAYLCTKNHEKATQEAFKGRKRASFEIAPRGTIRDCHNIILATNTTEYEVRIHWSQFQQITNRALRKRYVTTLSNRLARILKNDPQDIEDTLYSFAALNPQIPYVLQKGLSEEQYHTIRALEHLFPGLEAAKSFRRVYPKEKLACHVLGYTAAIQQDEYNRLLHKRHELEQALRLKEEGAEPDGPTQFDYASHKQRLDKLTRQAYSLLDRVGKTGVEASYETALRGKRGMNRFFANAQGAFIRPLSGAHSTLPGDRIVLTLSSILQEHCEKLLAESDAERRALFETDIVSLKPSVMNPFQRGGAIIALEPSTGAVRALASFPRMNPNDFSPKTDSSQDTLHQWLAQPSFIEMLWNQATPYFHEKYNRHADAIETEEIWLDWNFFLSLVLPKDSSLPKFLERQRPLIDFIKVQQALFKLSDIFGYQPDELLFHLYQEELSPDILSQLQHPINLQCKRELDKYMLGFQTHDDRLLLVDLMRLVIRLEEIDSSELEHIKGLSVGQFRSAVCQCLQEFKQLKAKRFTHFWKTDFRKWRKENETTYLKQIRLQEKQEKKRAQPYLILLKREAKRQFEELWGDNWHEWMSNETQLKTAPALIPLLIRSSSTDFPLLGCYQSLPAFHNQQTGLSLLCPLQSILLPSTSSLAFQHATPPGSIFKLTVAYAALIQRERECRGSFHSNDVDFFQIIDKTYKSQNKQFVGQFLDNRPIPQIYKGGRIPKSAHPDFGLLNLSQAIAVSSNPYFSLLASEYLDSPASLEQSARLLGYESRTGIDLPAEYKGNFPTDLETNKTGLYTAAIGQHTLLTTPLQTAMMISTLANGGKVVVPKIVQKIIATDARGGNKTQMPKAEALTLLGLSPSLFIETRCQPNQIQVETKPEEVRSEIFMPTEVRKCLMKSMQKAVRRIAGDTQSLFRRKLHSQPEKEKALALILPQIVGKTSTAEVSDRFGLQRAQKPFLYNHIWFGGIYFSQENIHLFQTPELVVVVYLRYGSYGKESLPLATSVINKWLEINKSLIPSSLSGPVFSSKP